MTRGADQGTAGRLAPAGAAVAVAGFAVNGLAYVVPVLAARRLGPADVGALAVVLALAAIASVAGLGLQAALAVRWARDGAVPNAGRVTLGTAAAAAGVLVVGTPVFSMVLHLSPALPPLVAATTAAVVIASRRLGELQGRQQFGRLAAAMVLLSVARYGGVLVGLLAGAGVVGSVATGAVLAWLVLPAFALVSGPPGRDPARPGAPALRAADVASAGTATLAMLAVSYADLILARAALPAVDSGVYAVGAILTKGAMWAPGVVTILVLPRLAQGNRRALAVALAVVCASGAVLTTASAVAGGLAMGLAGGQDYTRFGGYAAAFAVVGALYAVAFVLVNDEIAGRVRWPGAILLPAIAGLATWVALQRPATLTGILTASVITAAVTTAALAAAALRRHRVAGPEA